MTKMNIDEAKRALDVIQKQFPKNSRQMYSTTGFIPMDWFERNEVELREFIRILKLRVVFRGPRFDEGRAATRRSDATGVVLYLRSM